MDFVRPERFPLFVALVEMRKGWPNLWAPLEGEICAPLRRTPTQTPVGLVAAHWVCVLKRTTRASSGTHHNRHRLLLVIVLAVGRAEVATATTMDEESNFAQFSRRNLIPHLYAELDRRKIHPLWAFAPLA